MPRRRIDISELSEEELTAAKLAITDLSARMPIEDVERVCMALARGEVLFRPAGPTTLCANLRMGSTLLRNEVAYAVALQMRLLLELMDEESSAHVVAFLGQRGAAYSLLLGMRAHAAAMEAQAALN